jgi:hypothetical protein
MSDPVDDFFTGLSKRGYEPLLQHVIGSIRFDLENGDETDHWWVGLDRGKVTVLHEDRVAKSVSRQDRSTLIDAILGRRNPMTTFLQGDAGYSGEGEPLVIFSRLFPDRSVTDRSGEGRPPIEDTAGKRAVTA